MKHCLLSTFSFVGEQDDDRIHKLFVPLTDRVSEELSMSNVVVRRGCRQLFFVLCSLIITTVAFKNALAGDAFYFSLQASGQLPISPASFQVQSPTFIMVPAGASLRVYLLRGNVVVTTSTLTFESSFNNGSLLPAVPVAA